MSGTGVAFRAVSPISRRSLPIALLSIMLIIAAQLIPQRSPFDRSAVVGALIDSLKPVASEMSAGPSSADGELGKAVLEALNELEKGDLVEAAIKARKAIAELESSPSSDPDAVRSALIEVGVDPVVAKALAFGEDLGLGGGSSTSGSALKEAGDKIGGSAGASLAKAGERILLGESVEEALKEAVQAARKARAEAEKREELLARIRSAGAAIFAEMSEEERAALAKKLGGDLEGTGASKVGRGNALAFEELMRLTLVEPQYPLELRGTIVEYYSLLKKDLDD
ncbi:MAG: hypothetical protein Kow00107_09840 [Planctomycetota bacterium]